jgi:hypothetical protein
MSFFTVADNAEQHSRTARYVQLDAIRSQCYLTDGIAPPGMRDRHVSKAIGSTRIGRKHPQRLWLVVAVDCASALCASL